MLILQGFKDKKTALVADMDVILKTAADENRDITEDEQARFDELNAECDVLNGKITTRETLLRRQQEVKEQATLPLMDRKISPDQVAHTEPLKIEVDKVTIPATVKRWGSLKSFKGADADVRAYKAGQFYFAMFGNEKAKQWCAEHGLMAAVHQENINTKGGYLVYDQLDNDIIDLRKEYGVFERLARTVAMTSDTILRPRRTGGLTATFFGEDTAITESDKGWDQVQLIAKKLGVIARITNELTEDAIINIADDLTGEIAYAFAKKIDECGFAGDGSATYGGMVGVRQALSDVNGVNDGGGLVLVSAAGGNYLDPTLAELNKLISICPSYARRGAVWCCSPLVYDQVIARLAQAAGGNTVRDIIDGVPTEKALGYPVVMAEAMPSTEAVSQICILFGNFAQAADFGDRRRTTIAQSDSAVVGSKSVFERDEIAVRGTIRFDINVHDVGTATVPGPVVGLILAAA